MLVNVLHLLDRASVIEQSSQVHFNINSNRIDAGDSPHAKTGPHKPDKLVEGVMLKTVENPQEMIFPQQVLKLE